MAITAGITSSYTNSLGGGSTGPYSNGYITGTTVAASTYPNINVGSIGFPTDPELLAEIDNMKVQLEAAVALMEKLNIECRYWHIRAEALEKLLNRDDPTQV